MVAGGAIRALYRLNRILLAAPLAERVQKRKSQEKALKEKGIHSV